ncbi:MAG TPA: NosD domain-containing protein [Methanoregulaceae archaeon]|nr:NosD domain-containing protein [Methanoregulaceae archaeon]HQJ87739.1 NosD domain-containing protein [Methanoregulaceae archaeon]
MIRTLLSLVLVLFTLIPFAAATMIDGPTVITAPGTYQLTSDVVGADRDAAIEIIASNVVLEGGGHVLAGTSARDIPGILIRTERGTGPADVVVRNLTVKDWTYGVHALGASHLVLENVTSVGNREHGLYLFAVSNSTIRSCRVEQNEGSGIVLSDVSHDNVVEQNTVVRNRQNGLMLIASDRNHLTGNTVRENGAFGIDCYLTKENLIADNLFFNTNNTHVEELDRNTWSFPRSAGPNIAGGPEKGGNYWGEPGGGGFSDLTPDANGDGFCDSPFVIYEGNMDSLPLKGEGTSRPTPTSASGPAAIVAILAIVAVTLAVRWR